MSVPSSENIQISQGLEILVPKGGPAFPIPCSEWHFLKNKLKEISRPPRLFQSLGFVSLGASLSTFINLLIGAFPSTPSAKATAWAVVAVTAVCALVLLCSANQQRKLLEDNAVTYVVKQMELIEERYDRDMV